MNLENEKTKKSYDFWKNTYPKSLNDLDVNRFDELSLILLENNDVISDHEIEQTLGADTDEQIIDFYTSRFKVLKIMYKLMINNGYTK